MLRYERADLVVVGGGPVGTFAALLASQRGLSVLLVDQGRPRALDPLAFSLSRSALELLPMWLESLSLWQEHGPQQGLRRTPQVLLSLDPEDAMQDLHHRLADRLPVELLEREALCREHPEFKPGPGWALRGPFNGRLTGGEFLSHHWQRLAGVWADTEVKQLDLEHEQPTAVAGDTVFRGNHLLVCAADASPALLHHSNGYTEFSCWAQDFAEVKMVDHVCQQVELLGDAVATVVADDRDSLGKHSRWLRPGLLLDGAEPREVSWKEPSDRLPVLAPLDFRQDIAGAYGLGRAGPALAAGLARQALSCLLADQPWPQKLDSARFKPEDPPPSAKPQSR